jgi:hypothetical protein
MAVPWTDKQRPRIVKILTDFPVDSALCDRAAARVLPVARESDELAVARRCDPRFGIYVSPQRKWFFHVTVRTVGHYVDALAGPDGLPEAEYLASRWQHSDALVWRDLADEELNP